MIEKNAWYEDTFSSNRKSAQFSRIELDKEPYKVEILHKESINSGEEDESSKN
jgi:hypothetical protein